MKMFKNKYLLEIDMHIQRDYEILLVMPLMEGGSLDKFYDYVQPNGFNEPDVLFFAV